MSTPPGSGSIFRKGRGCLKERGYLRVDMALNESFCLFFFFFLLLSIIQIRMYNTNYLHFVIEGVKNLNNY